MRLFLFVWITFIVANGCFSQIGTIHGQVYDSNEKTGLAYVKVRLDRTEMKTTTNPRGKFKLDSVPVGIYDLTTSHYAHGDTTISSIHVSEDTLIELNITFSTDCIYDHKSKRCPVCNKRNEVIPIVYGLPSTKMMDNAKKGKLKLGGCVITGCDPHWYCKRDNRKF